MNTVIPLVDLTIRMLLCDGGLVAQPASIAGSAYHMARLDKEMIHVCCGTEKDSRDFITAQGRG